jgi:hypothetical protein
LSAPELLLRLDLSNLAAGVQDNIGLDNLRFGQTPPRVAEPGAGAMLLAGLVALARGQRARPPGSARPGVRASVKSSVRGV